MNLPSGNSPSRSPCLWNPVLLVISDQWLVVSEICLLIFGFCLPIPNWRRRRPPLCPCASVPSLSRRRPARRRRMCHLALARSACATRHWALEFNTVGVETCCAFGKGSTIGILFQFHRSRSRWTYPMGDACVAPTPSYFFLLTLFPPSVFSVVNYLRDMRTRKIF